MNKPIVLWGMVLCLSIFSCSNPVESKQSNHVVMKEGMWQVRFGLPDADLPFNLEVHKKDSSYTFVVINDIEKIPINDVSIHNDSFFIPMPVFQSELIGKIDSDTTFSGFWHNYSKGKDYKIAMNAKHGIDHRFAPSSTSEEEYNVDGNWEVTFSADSEEPCKAIGVFKQSNNKLSGTFITETGDYRFLDGNVIDDSMFLSCFDGSHAFLFKAAISDSNINGQFWSGNHWKENWIAVRNDEFKLTHPDSLTFLKDGYEELSFSFPNLDSTIVSLNDDKYQDKVVIVQIMGSWCPNCADETAFLTDLYNDYHSRGLEIIALAYEKSDYFDESVSAVKKMKEHFTTDYDFLIAGKANKKEAQKTLPMLNHIMSYPTCIFIDKNKKIRKIRTGFYGPGTGEIYETHIKETIAFTEQLLNDNGSGIVQK